MVQIEFGTFLVVSFPSFCYVEPLVQGQNERICDEKRGLQPTEKNGYFLCFCEFIRTKSLFTEKTTTMLHIKCVDILIFSLLL